MILYKNVYLYINKCIKKEGALYPFCIVVHLYYNPMFFHTFNPSQFSQLRHAVIFPCSNLLDLLFPYRRWNIHPQNSKLSIFSCSYPPIMGGEGGLPSPSCHFIHAVQVCFHRTALSDCRNGEPLVEENGFSFYLFSTPEAVIRALTHLLSRWT